MSTETSAMPRPWIPLYRPRPTTNQYYYFTSNTDPKPSSSKILIGVFIAFIAVILLLTYFCVRCVSGSRRQAVGNDAAAPATARASVDSSRKAGINSVALACLPVFVYGCSAGDKGSVEECAVCLLSFNKGEECRLLPRCGHSFHAGCVDMWLCSHVTCPLCRAPVREQSIVNDV